MGLTPRQKLEDFVESGDTSTWPAATPYVSQTEMVTAMSALHIGDRLGELTRAINRAVNPSSADLDQRFEQAAQLTEKIIAHAEGRLENIAAGTTKKAYCPRCQSHSLGGIPDDTRPWRFDDPATWRCLTCKYEGPRDAFYHDSQPDLGPWEQAWKEKHREQKESAQESESATASPAPNDTVAAQAQSASERPKV